MRITRKNLLQIEKRLTNSPPAKSWSKLVGEGKTANSVLISYSTLGTPMLEIWELLLNLSEMHEKVT